MPDKRQLILSLNSQICPACGKNKKRGQTFCGGDYHALPVAFRKALYNRIGWGYEQAFDDALLSLDVTDPHWPADPIPPSFDAFP